jgi:hypothetical protein
VPPSMRMVTYLHGLHTIQAPRSYNSYSECVDLAGLGGFKHCLPPPPPNGFYLHGLGTIQAPRGYTHHVECVCLAGEHL